MRLTLISDFSTQFIKKEFSRSLALLNRESTIVEIEKTLKIKFLSSRKALLKKNPLLNTSV